MKKEWLLGQNQNTEACDDEIFLNQGAEAVILQALKSNETFPASF